MDEERLQIVEAAPCAMLMVGADGLIALVNTRVERLFGYERGELLGRPVEMLVPKRFRRRDSGHRGSLSATPSLRAVSAGRDLSKLPFGLRKDGGEVPIQLGLNPITTKDGRFVLASVVDLSEKTALLKEIHHRVKNNLQIVCSLLSLQIESSTADRASVALKDAHSRILALSMIHEQIYSSESLADLDVGEYVRLLSARLFGAYCVDPSGIRLETTVGPVRMTIDHAIPCGLIINELLANSLKHAFRNGRAGTVRISLTTDTPGFVEMEVADNGCGLPAGFRLEESRSLGLQVVRALTGQIGAVLSVSGDGGGTSFRFKWKQSADGEFAARLVDFRQPSTRRLLPPVSEQGRPGQARTRRAEAAGNL
jgi:PAS domain S-box-containing protein